MASAVREISSSAAAQDSLDPTASPPSAAATPTIACRRVVPLPCASRCNLSRILVLPSICVPSPPHESTSPKYVQDNISLGRCAPFKAYFSTQEQGGLMPYPAGHRVAMKKNIINSARR